MLPVEESEGGWNGGCVDAWYGRLGCGFFWQDAVVVGTTDWMLVGWRNAVFVGKPNHRQKWFLK